MALLPSPTTSRRTTTMDADSRSKAPHQFTHTMYAVAMWSIVCSILTIPVMVASATPPLKKHDFLAVALMDPEGNGKFVQTCGASLIAQNVILSSAQCLNMIDEVMIGRYDLSDVHESYEQFRVVEKVIHPLFNPMTLDYDYMVLQIDGSSSYSPVSLMNRMDHDGATNSAPSGLIVTGWGTATSAPLKATGYSKILLASEIDHIPSVECMASYGSGVITDRMMCAEAASCDGDLGGPVLDGQSGKQVGIVSWGKCGVSNIPEVYSRVSEGCDFIQEYVRKWTSMKTSGITEKHGFQDYRPREVSAVPSNVPSPILSLSSSPTQLSQKEILQEFYNSLGGTNWNCCTDWFAESVPVCSYTNITCTNGAISTIVLKDVNLMGTIPTVIGLLSHLEELGLDHNQFLSGTIPTELGQLTRLVTFELDSTQLSGSIPSEIGYLTSLYELELDSNSLAGTIPSELGYLTSLHRLDLDRNSLTGTIPSELGYLMSLYRLDLKRNSLTGTISSELGYLTSLYRLDMDRNSLSGTIPTELTSLYSLGHVYLRDNSLTGPVPIFDFELMANLTDLYLDDNMLTGTIAECGEVNITADCGGLAPEIVCSCCGYCYTSVPTPFPSLTANPSARPSVKPSSAPTKLASAAPSSDPSNPPSIHSSDAPTNFASGVPSLSSMPTASPIVAASANPNGSPTNFASMNPTIAITTQMPSDDPSVAPSRSPVTSAPTPTAPFTLLPSDVPSEEPSGLPTHAPSQEPSALPSRIPTHSPSSTPTIIPSNSPMADPTDIPTNSTSHTPTHLPSMVPQPHYSDGSTHAPTTSPTIPPSVNPSALPSTQPINSTQTSNMPTPLPSVLPSSSPSITPPVTTFITSPSIHETDYTGDEARFLEHLTSFDADFRARLIYATLDFADDPYASSSSSSINAGRRSMRRRWLQMSSDYSPFEVESVESSLTYESCTPLQEDNYCYTVDTIIGISHHPHLYTKESVNLIVTGESAEFISERELYDGDIPVPLEADIVLILKGVEPRLMEPDEREILEMTIIEFLNNKLLSNLRQNNSAPILIEDAEITYQEIVTSTAATNSTEEATLQADVTISGEYLPPPDVNDFGDVVIEAINEDEEEFIETLEENAVESNETYFSYVSDVDAMTEEAMGGGVFDIVAFAGYTAAAFVGFAGVLSCISVERRRRRRRNQDREADELRARAIQTAKSVHNLNVRRFETVRLGRIFRMRASRAASPTDDQTEFFVAGAMSEDTQNSNSNRSLLSIPVATRSVQFDLETEHVQPKSTSSL